MTATTLGYAALAAGQPLQAFSFERRAPLPDDVVIDIAYCGVCHSDVHAVHDAWGTTQFPVVPGHEITGTVREVGAAVTRFAPGDRVGVGCFVDSCTHTGYRDPVHEHYLPGLVMTYNGQQPGASTPTRGGFATTIVVKEGYVLALPAELPLAAAAPLLCAGITVYSPLRHWRVGPGSRVAIVGLGGLGHLAVKLAVALGAEVTVISRTRAKADDARRLGATGYVTTDALAQVAGAFDLVLSTVSGDVDWNGLLATLTLDGTLVTVGVPEAPVAVSAFPLIVGRRRIAGSFIGSIAETQELLEFCAQHHIVADIETIAMRDINTAFARVTRSDVRYRFVVDASTITT